MLREIKIRGVKIVRKNRKDTEGRFFPFISTIEVKRGKGSFEILLHEFCHLVQYYEDPKKWKKSYDAGLKMSAKADFFMPQKEISKAMGLIIKMELDCERRAVTLLQSFGIPHEDYLSRANSRIISYFYAKKTASFKPYTVSKEILTNLRANLVTKKKEIPKNIKKLLDKYYE